MTNNERVELAEDAVFAFAEASGLEGEDNETKLSDLLADLRHWADQEKVDWAEAMRKADNHYFAETDSVCAVCGARFGLENSEREDICDECEEARTSGHGAIAAPGKGDGVSQETLQPGPRDDSAVG